jgi:hypothetical protein
MNNKGRLFFGWLPDQYSMLRWLDFIKQHKMDFKQLIFMNCATIKDPHLVLLKLLLVIHLEDSLLWVGTQVIATNKILNHSYSLSISKPSTLYFQITLGLSTVVQIEAQYLVVAMKSVYMTIRIVTLPVMFAVVMVIAFLMVQMGMIQYWLMAIQTFKLLNSKYT